MAAKTWSLYRWVRLQLLDINLLHRSLDAPQIALIRGAFL